MSSSWHKAVDTFSFLVGVPYPLRFKSTIAGASRLTYAALLMQVRLLTQFETTPAQSVATDRYFLHTVIETQLPVLRVYTYPDDVLLLGRYQAAGAQSGNVSTSRVRFEDTFPLFSHNSGLTMTRRLTGGRAFPSGNGFVQFSLIVPHRSFFFSADPYHLAPFQLLNRYVRGVLRGLKTSGIEVFYPGRDFLTVRRLPIGWHSFMTEETGALLYEGGVFVQRDMGLLPHFLDRADPNGTIPCQLFLPDHVTNLEKVLGQPPSQEQVVGLLRHGFAQQFGLEPLNREAQELSEDEQVAIMAEQEKSDAGLSSRPLQSALPCVATMQTPLGELQVRFSLTPEQTIQTVNEVRFSGDFIANPAGMQALEHNLKGCPLEQEALWRVIDQTFLQPEHYLIGAGKLEDVPGLIRSASSLTPLR